MIAASETMKKKRKIKDSVLNIITYLSSALSVFVLLAIFVFIFSKGSGTLGLKMLTGNYWSSIPSPTSTATSISTTSDPGVP